MATATTGIDELDEALGGLYWGDNVVWEVEDDDAIRPFYDAVAASADLYDQAAYVTLTRAPDEVEAAYPGLDVVDARPGGRLARPGALVEEIGRRCSRSRRDLLLFDPLETMVSQWGAEAARGFFTRSCPLLLELGAIAYWSFVPTAIPQAVRTDVEGVTQCVVVLRDGRVRVAKAEGRPPGVEGSVFRYQVANGAPTLAAAPTAARLGSALRSVRKARRLTQNDLARMAGISASAISQAERGQRGLSLETLVDLSDKLSITLDELLRGKVAPGYRLARRDDPRERVEGRPWPLMDDPRAGLRAYGVRLGPRESATPEFVHKGVELVAVASGLVQVTLDTGRPVLRGGETLIADSSAVQGWRNLSDREAFVFWVLRDERER